MQLARVVGTVVATRKDAGLHGATLLILQPLTPERQPVGQILIGVDSVGAGAPSSVPTDASVIGIVDHWFVAPSKDTTRRRRR